VDEGYGAGRLAGAALVEALAGVVSTLRRHVDPMGGVVCRIQPLLIGLVAPGIDQPTLLRVIETARAEIEKASPGWGRARHLALQRVKTTAGVAVREPGDPAFTKPEQVVAAAAAALRQALAGGGMCVRTYGAVTAKAA
jgi:GGDEF domain-containing protein